MRCRKKSAEYTKTSAKVNVFSKDAKYLKVILYQKCGCANAPENLGAKIGLQLGN